MSTPSLDRTVNKVYWHLIPLLIISTGIRSNDRLNLSLAKLKIAQDLVPFRNHSDAIFGVGEAVNLLGSLILPIPSTIVIEKWSAAKWFSVLSITWGLASLFTGFITEAWHFYLARFFFGFTASGYLTSVYVYVTYWFPVNHQGRVISLIFVSMPVAQVINPLISYPLLRLGTTENSIYYETVFHLRGWQCL